MSTEDEKTLSKILNFVRAGSIVILTAHAYWFCHALFARWGLTHSIIDNFLLKFNSTGMFRSIWTTKLVCLLLLMVSCMGNRGKKDEKININQIMISMIAGAILFFSNQIMLTTHLPLAQRASIYCVMLLLGYILFLLAFVLISRLLRLNLMKDVFNVENESFMQEKRFLTNKEEGIPTIHLPTKFYYQKQWHDGWINVVNPHRATNVLGTPGSGKSFAVINNYIKQLIEQGNPLYVYDYKFPALTKIVFNHFRLHPDGYKNVCEGITPKVYIINFDDPRKSHRCNPLHPSFMTDIADAYESAYIIMLNLNKTWIKKQGDFFVESPIILLAAIIWFLKIYQDGKYCTFPHAIELINKKYEDIFIILSTYPELENYMSPFKDALEGGAQDQLQGQIASAKMPLARIASKQLYWVLTGNDFTLDLNNPQEPKILCVGNNPKRENIYSTALGLINARIVQLINLPDRQPCAIIIDELPTMYFRKIDNLINTARSNKVAVCLGFQDYSQLKRDYGEDEYKVIVNTVGNIFSGQVLGDTSKGLSERFGKVLQQRQNISINRQDTSTSINTQMDSLIPAGKISNLRQGTFVGAVAEDFGIEMTQNIFHAKIMVDMKKIKEEEKKYIKLPQITSFTDQNGKDRLDEMIDANFMQIKADVEKIVEDEMNRIANDPNLVHLIGNENQQ